MHTPRNPDEEVQHETYLDCTGRQRHFALSLYAGGAFLSAHEVLENGEPGLRFVTPVRPGEPPPYGELRERVRERLAQRHVVRAPGGSLELLHTKVRAQLVEGEGHEGPPDVWVDDVRLTWEDLGLLLSSHVGFGLRLELHEAGNE